MRARAYTRATLALLLVACSSDGQIVKTQAPQPIKIDTPPPPDAAKKKDAEASAKVFRYVSVGRRDPFRTYLAEQALEQAKSSGRRRSDTELFGTEAFRVTLLVTGTSQPMAMVEDPSGKGHLLRVGTRIGLNNGRVRTIAQNTVTIEEEVTTLAGERKLVKVALVLHPPEERDKSMLLR